MPMHVTTPLMPTYPFSFLCLIPTCLRFHVCTHFQALILSPFILMPTILPSCSSCIPTLHSYPLNPFLSLSLNFFLITFSLSTPHALHAYLLFTHTPLNPFLSLSLHIFLITFSLSTPHALHAYQPLTNLHYLPTFLSLSSPLLIIHTFITQTWPYIEEKQRLCLQGCGLQGLLYASNRRRWDGWRDGIVVGHRGLKPLMAVFGGRGHGW